MNIVYEYSTSEENYVLHRSKVPKLIAPWPKRDQMKYEGDDRISTEACHRRFLGLPRVPGSETVNWQHRALVKPSWFDCHQRPVSEYEVWERQVYIPELEEFDGMHRTTAEEILGPELWKLLDPIGRI